MLREQLINLSRMGPIGTCPEELNMTTEEKEGRKGRIFKILWFYFVVLWTIDKGSRLCEEMCVSILNVSIILIDLIFYRILLKAIANPPTKYDTSMLTCTTLYYF